RPDTALRGGITLCWPWFANDRPGPAHGITRTSDWHLTRAHADQEGGRLVLTLPEGELSRQLPDEHWALEVESQRSDERRGGEGRRVLIRSRPDTALRGGIPLCWPWFAHDRPGPAHGIARTSDWHLTRAHADQEGVRLVLTQPEGEISRQLPDVHWALDV